MIRERDLIDGLRQLEQPVEPDADFAAALANRLTRTLTTAEPATLRPDDTDRFAIPAPRPMQSRSRHRLLDLAAVAILLLTMIGGLVRTTSLGDNPSTPTIFAPNGIGSTPVVLNGDPTGGNRLAADAPPLGGGTEAWKLPAPEFGVIRTVATDAERVYVVNQPADSGGMALLDTYDLSSGKLLWTQTINGFVPFVLTDQGIVVALISPSGSVGGAGTPRAEAGLTLALLDSSSGSPVWTSAELALAIPLATNQIRMLVAGNVIVGVDNEVHVVAVDFHSGQPIWNISYTRSVESALSENVCSNYQCTPRLSTAPSLAIGSGIAFLADFATTEIIALNIFDGTEMWRESLLARTNPVPAKMLDSLEIVASDQGPIIEYGSDATGQTVLELWPLMGPETLWTLEFPHFSFPPTIIGDGTFYLALTSGSDSSAECCEITQFDLGTGKQIWQGTSTETVLWTNYLIGDDSLIYRVLSQSSAGQLEPGSIKAMEPATHEPKWTFSPQKLGCDTAIASRASDGFLACLSSDSSVIVFAPMASIATPSASPLGGDNASPIAVNQDATGGGQVPGDPIAAPDYALQWQTDPMTEAALPLTTTFGDTVYIRTKSTTDDAVTLVAHDLETGAVKWRTTIAPSVPVIPTSVGVITLIPDGADSSLLRVARLSSETGSVEMISNARFPASVGLGPWTNLIVTGETALVADRTGLVRAIDLMTGETRWTANSSRSAAAGLSTNATCFEAQGCIVRTDMVPTIVSDGATVYLADSLTATVTALDLQTGQIKWQQSILNWMDSAAFGDVDVIATNRGPLVLTFAIDANDFITGEQIRMLALNSGEQIWSQNSPDGANYPVVTNHGTYYLAINPKLSASTPVPILEDCCLVTEHALADGSMIWQQDANAPMREIDGYLPASDTLLVSSFNAYHHSSEGMNATTHEPTFAFALNDRNCVSVLYPVAADGSVLCQNVSGNTVSIFAPVPIANPVASPSP